MTKVLEAEQATIFINYRRTDAGWPADLLAGKLRGTFGENRVFLDVREIDAGDEFPTVLEEKLRRATILVVLIGEGWLRAQDKYGRRRLDQGSDWVRNEIRAGLQRKSCRVIPVLIDDAALPDEREALPEDIAGLLTRQRVRLRQANSDADIEKLSITIEKAGFQRLPDTTESLTRTVSVPARIFFILCTFCSDVLKQLLLRQNQMQHVFDIGIANSWKYWEGRSNAEIELKSLQTKSRLEFCEKFQKHMAQYAQEYDRANFDGVNIAVTELPFPSNYYTWSTKNRKGVVIGINSLEKLFHIDSLTVNKIIIRIIQRMLVYSLGIKDLKAHEDTRGCLFDLTRELRDIQYSVDDIRICKECRNIISQDKGSQFLNEINGWIGGSFS